MLYYVMRVGLIDVDGHNFPNFALMKISAYHKMIGDDVEWAKQDDIFGQTYYDKIYSSKIFTFSPDVDYRLFHADEIVKGGSGYDIKGYLDDEIENCRKMDYSIYPQYDFSVQFTSRGCIRHCPFCLVHDKEGMIHSVKPHDLNPVGGHIEVLDNNFFSNPNWGNSVEYLLSTGKKVKLHGVDVRIMNEEQAKALKMLKHYRQPHIAWDLPNIDLRPQLEAMAKYIRPSSITCYVLIGFNSTIEQDLFRVRSLKELGYTPFVQPYRDFENKRVVTWYENDFARWANNHFFCKSCDFVDFEPRKGFKCGSYFDHPELMLMPFNKKIKPTVYNEA